MLEDEKLNIELSEKKIKEMIFIYNALDNGWTIKKKRELYIFTKKHYNKKEVFNNDYLQRFVDDNSVLNNKILDISSILNK
jgi:hypothetical protein